MLPTGLHQNRAERLSRRTRADLRPNDLSPSAFAVLERLPADAHTRRGLTWGGKGTEYFLLPAPGQLRQETMICKPNDDLQTKR
jgi:hypothetical protein